jgi:hypothetical protein
MWWHPEWRQAHTGEMKSNIERFRTGLRTLRPVVPTQIKDLQDEIDVYTKYEDYIYKIRQAQHIHTQVYGPTLSGIATAAIAFIVFIFGIVAYFFPATPSLSNQADTVLKVFEKSDHDQAASKLNALPRAGLITVRKSTIQNLVNDWYGPR